MICGIERQIRLGTERLERALAQRRIGPYQLEAAIAAAHATAPSAEETDWVDIAGLYGLLARIAPSPVVSLNRAVAIAMADGPAVGLALVDQVAAEGTLDDHLLLHSTRADLLRRLDRPAEARVAYERALALAPTGPEARFLHRRLDELG